MTSISLFALALCCAWASGINVYAVLLVLGLCAEFNGLYLPAELDGLTSPLMILFFGFMYCVEFVADKIPGVDSLWDLLHTFIRIPLAVFLVGALIDEQYPDWQLVAQCLAALVALCAHAAKAGGRLLINTSPEPFSNWAASCAEDILVFFALWLAFTHPVLLCLLLVGFILLLIWLLPKLIHALSAVVCKVYHWLSGRNNLAS